MPEIIKQPENYTPLTKNQETKALRNHLLMMLEAMQYKGNIKHIDNDKLRELVEEQKIIFLRKLQDEIEKEYFNKHGRPLSAS